jgi:hypothetical protein
MARSKEHPGFLAIQKRIAQRGYGMKRAGAILAKRTREASPEAKRANPRLENVRPAKRRTASRVSRRGSYR